MAASALKIQIANSIYAQEENVLLIAQPAIQQINGQMDVNVQWILNVLQYIAVV